jgi:hypothetical protein
MGEERHAEKRGETVRRFAGFIATTIGVAVFGAWVITLAVPGEETRHSVWMSALLVVIVQALAFSLVRVMQPLNVIAGWGLGMLLRLFALVAFGLFGVKALGLSMQPALLSMAGFFFVSTLIEPVFLKP